VQPSASHVLRLAIVAGSLALVEACAAEAPTPPPAVAPTEVRVLTFNMWHGGDAGGQPLEQSVEVVRASGADVVGLQETHGRERNGERPDHGAAMARALGWHYLDQGHRTGILSRWPIVGTHGDRAGATVRLPSGQTLYVFNVHLAHAPYQPYQLLRIPYENAPFLTTADEAVEAASTARGRQIADVLAIVRPLVAEGAPVVLTGDFNEPSHLDWTPRAADAGVVPLAVPYPASRAVVETGLRDAFRTAFPDEVGRPGWTWTPTTRSDDPADRHDRIDFVYVGTGPGTALTEAQVVGEDATTADIVVRPWPSDHRAVVATVALAAPR
jgi:endonuclease/exonuclease/phosphatase family metal-dependent hydrolase